MVAWSSEPATGASSSSAAWSTRCAARSRCRKASIERNAGVPPERRIEFRVGIHLGDVVEEADGDLMGDGVNIAARLEGIAKPGAICLSEDAYRQVSGRLDHVGDRSRPDASSRTSKRPIRVYSLEVGKPAPAKLRPRRSPPTRRSIARAARVGLRGVDRDRGWGLVFWGPLSTPVCPAARSPRGFP